jgi:hypothetical protein
MEEIMKQFRFFTFLYLFTFLGCAGSADVTLRQAPSDLLLLSVKQSPAIALYQFRSEIPDNYVYTNARGYQFFFSLNWAYLKNLQAYLQTKFLQSRDTTKLTYYFDITIESVSMKYQFNQSSGDVISDWADALSRRGRDQVHGEGVAGCELRVRVTVNQNNKTIGDKLIVTSVNSSERFSSSTSVERIYGMAVDDCISKSLIFIDKYLSSIGI